MTDALRGWVDWFGFGRLVSSALAVATVCVGGYWLVRTPAPPSEAALPFAAPAPSGPTVTLDPPVPSSTPSSSAPVIEGIAEGVVVVHVAGAVASPGVYELLGGSRVADALDAAGGAGVGADVDRLNLAARLADGSRVLVPLVGEELASELIVFAPQPAASVADPAIPAGPINVNEASVSELETLPGVGPATATAIVTERERNGPFASVDELDRVPGIGPAKLEALRDLVAT